nr:MAG TPA: hypothetical protein [Caudoviricetes sp.]DAX71724.1 MAG TPA: hypothetical protein [Caudoviricetes sp.]
MKSFVNRSEVRTNVEPEITQLTLPSEEQGLT